MWSWLVLRNENLCLNSSHFTGLLYYQKTSNLKLLSACWCDHTLFSEIKAFVWTHLTSVAYYTIRQYQSACWYVIMACPQKWKPLCELISFHRLTILSDNVRVLGGLWSWLVLKNKSSCVNSSHFSGLLYYQTMSECLFVCDHGLSSEIKTLVWTHFISLAYYIIQFNSIQNFILLLSDNVRVLGGLWSWQVLRNKNPCLNSSHFTGILSDKINFKLLLGMWSWLVRRNKDPCLNSSHFTGLLYYQTWNFWVLVAMWSWPTLRNKRPLSELISLQWLTILSNNVRVPVGVWSWLVLRNKSPCVNSSHFTVILSDKINFKLLIGMWSWLVLRNKDPCLNSSHFTGLLYYQKTSNLKLNFWVFVGMWS